MHLKTHHQREENDEFLCRHYLKLPESLMMVVCRVQDCDEAVYLGREPRRLQLIMKNHVDTSHPSKTLEECFNLACRGCGQTFGLDEKEEWADHVNQDHRDVFKRSRCISTCSSIDYNTESNRTEVSRTTDEDVENNNTESATILLAYDVTESSPNVAGGQTASSATISDVQPSLKRLQSTVWASLESRKACQSVQGPAPKLSQSDKLGNKEAMDNANAKQELSADNPLSEQEQGAPKKLNMSSEQCPAKARNKETKSSSSISTGPDPSREQDKELRISSLRDEETNNDRRQFEERDLMLNVCQICKLDISSGDPVVLATHLLEHDLGPDLSKFSQYCRICLLAGENGEIKDVKLHYSTQHCDSTAVNHVAKKPKIEDSSKLDKVKQTHRNQIEDTENLTEIGVDECFYCNDSVEPEVRDFHILTQHRKNSFICQLCNRSKIKEPYSKICFHTIQDAGEHMKTAHGVDILKRLNIGLCSNEECSVYPLLKSVYYSNLGLPIDFVKFKCGTCAKFLLSQAAMKSHICNGRKKICDAKPGLDDKPKYVEMICRLCERKIEDPSKHIQKYDNK